MGLLRLNPYPLTLGRAADLSNSQADVPDAKIIELAKYSAENNSADGQLFYAGRLKDGTLTKRDEIGARNGRSLEITRGEVSYSF